MRFQHLTLGVMALAAAGGVSTGASAGEWRLNPSLCPDLVEDRLDRRESRRDERYNRGLLDRAEDRADRRESRRDERVTVCPRSAWVWTGTTRTHIARPRAANIYYNAADRQYYRYGTNRARVRIILK